MCLLEILNTHLNSLQRTNLRDIEQLVQQSIPNDHVVHRRLWTDTLLEFVRNADRFPSYEELASYVQETNEQTKLDLNDSIIVQILWLLNYCVDLPIHPQCLQSYVEQDDWKRIFIARLRFWYLRWNISQVESWLSTYFPLLYASSPEHVLQVQIMCNMFMKLFVVPEKGPVPKGRPCIPEDVKRIVKFKYQQRNCERMKNIYKLHNLFTKNEVDSIIQYVPNELRSIHEKLQILKSHSKQTIQPTV